MGQSMPEGSGSPLYPPSAAALSERVDSMKGGRGGERKRGKEGERKRGRGGERKRGR
jgi:hypothetical protein